MAPEKLDNVDLQEEMDIVEYFSKPYVPLSNLPTPPMSSHSNDPSRELTPDSLFDGFETLNGDLIGPAIYLTNLIPPRISLSVPSSAVLHSLLVRADLPTTTMALAAVILDSLDARFAPLWRRSLSSSLQSINEDQKIESPSIDTIRPELLAFAALIIADKFLDDHEGNTSYYAKYWGKGLWKAEHINIAQKTIFDHLNWRIKPLCEDTLLQEAKVAMQRVGQEAFKTKQRRRDQENSKEGSKIPPTIPLDEKELYKHDAIHVSTMELFPII